ncbi:MAG: hypothetical protein AB7T63_04865 [Planctomycetota bacterium]
MRSPRLTHRMLPTLLATWVLVVAGGAAAWPDGDEQEPARDPLVTLVFDLGPLVGPPPVRGPNLATPADLIARAEVAEGIVATWNQDPADERTPFVPFEMQPDGERWAASPDEWCELLREASHPLAAAFEMTDGAGIDVVGDKAFVRVPASLADEARRQAAWCFSALFPTGRIDAVLERVAPETSVRAVGRALLLPGRWVPVAFVKEELPCVVGSHVEIAQDSVVLDPLVANLVEGHEIYARLLPGETRSVVELWVGEVEHLETARIDVAGLQGPLRASELTTLTLPTTRVRRVGTGFVLPNGRREERVVTWRRGDTVEQLRLAVSTPGEPPAMAEGRDDHKCLALRLGARHGRLELGAREVYDVDLEEHLARYVQTADPEGLLQENASWGMTTTGAGILRGPAELLENVRQALFRAEQEDLGGLDARVDLLAVPEETWRAAGGMGVLAPGLPLPAARRASLEAEGAVLVAGQAFPSVMGLRSSFRLGESVPGLIDLDTEVAEKAAGFSTLTWSLFDGVFGSVSLERAGTGRVLDVRAEATWASPGGGQLALRRPSGERVQLALVGGGGTNLSARHAVAASGAEPLIAAVAVRGGHVLLLVVDVRDAGR